MEFKVETVIVNGAKLNCLILMIHVLDIPDLNCIR